MGTGHSYSAGGFAVRVVATGVGRTEGPVIMRSGRIIFTSMSDGCLYELTESGPTLFADTGGGPTGAAEGSDGRVFVAQLGPHHPAKLDPRVPGGVQVVDGAGAVEYLSLDPIMPNDLCFGPDGYLYVTDPTRRPEWDDGRIWRIDIVSGDAELMLSVNWFPNGIAFGIEDDSVYVASTFERAIHRYALVGNRLGARDTFAILPYGRPDGMAFDVDGNLVVCAVADAGNPSEVQIFDPRGKVVDRRCPGPGHLYTNVALAADGTAYVTDMANGRVLEITDWARPGLPLHPFREAG